MSSHSNGVRVLHRAADASNLGRCDSGKNVGNKSPIIACSDLAGMASIIPSSIPSFHPIRLISTMKNSTETLVTCPTCNTPNFTERGLKAHRCNGIDRTLTNSAPGGRNSREQLQPVAAAPGTLSDDALMGAQLTEQFKKAITATREVVIFGAMMIRAREHTVSTRGHGGKFGEKGEGFKAWLDEFSPDVARSRPTAYRFMALAEGVQEEFNVGKKCDLTLLLTAPDDELTPALRNKQRSILDFLEGKSQRQLLLQLGGDEEKTKSPRKKHDEDLTPEQEFELVTGALKKDANELFSTLETYAQKKHFQVLNDAELDAAISTLDEARTAMEAWRKTPKGKRLADAVQNEIRLWKGVK